MRPDPCRSILDWSQQVLPTLVRRFKKKIDETRESPLAVETAKTIGGIVVGRCRSARGPSGMVRMVNNGTYLPLHCVNPLQIDSFKFPSIFQSHHHWAFPTFLLFLSYLWQSWTATAMPLLLGNSFPFFFSSSSSGNFELFNPFLLSGTSTPAVSSLSPPHW